MPWLNNKVVKHIGIYVPYMPMCFIQNEVSIKVQQYVKIKAVDLASGKFQILLAAATESAPITDKGDPLNQRETEAGYFIENEKFNVTFNKETGFLEKYQVNGKVIFEQGPRPNLWRAPTDNDRGAAFNPMASSHSGLKFKQALRNNFMEDFLLKEDSYSYSFWMKPVKFE